MGTPAASAAPGDAACLQAAAQVEAAVAGTGITAESLAQLELSAESVAAAEAQYATLVGGAGGPSLVELEQAAQQLGLAEESGDPAAIAAAQARLAELEAQLTTALESLDPATVEQAVTDSTVIFADLLGQLGLTEATAGQLLGLLEQTAAACGATVAPVAPAPVAPAPVVEAPAAPVEAAPVGVNPGLDIQTGAAAEEPGAGLFAVAAGVLAVAVTAAVAVRRRTRS